MSLHQPTGNNYWHNLEILKYGVATDIFFILVLKRQGISSYS